MFTARQAEKAAAIAVDGVKQLMSSEQAAQDTIAQTHLDFEAYMLQYFTRCFMMGRVIALAPPHRRAAGHVVRGNHRRLPF